LIKTITKMERTVAAMPSITRVAAYARVSSGKDEMLHSLAAQVSHYKNYILNHKGWSFAGVYADEDFTGTKGNRPEFLRMVNDCRGGKIDLVLTKSISRFARNTVDLLETVRELKDLDIGVYFEEQNIHTLSGDGELMLTVLAAYAQEESLSASENQKWRIRNGYKEGRPSNHIRIYGYNNIDGVLSVIPEEAFVVRMIFSDYLSGMGKNAIMRKLLRLDIPTKYGGKWGENSIDKILRNEKYIGDMLLQKGFVDDHLNKLWKKNKGELPQYYVENHHEAIIDRETFDAVQREIERRSVKRERTSKNRSEFYGIIRCQRCGANFRKKTYAIGTKYEKDSWTCGTFITKGKAHCKAKRIPEDILKQKCAEALEIPSYNPVVFSEKVKQITAPDDTTLVFIFRDGTEKTLRWENRSRSESWTDEMRTAAAKRAKARGGFING
jgi:site-specific DNA recombinase